MRAPRRRRGATGSPQAVAWGSGRSPSGEGAHVRAPRRRRGATGSPQAVAWGSGRSPVWGGRARARPAAAARGDGVPASRRVGFGAQPRLRDSPAPSKLIEGVEQRVGVGRVIVEVGRDPDRVPAQRDEDLTRAQTARRDGRCLLSPEHGHRTGERRATGPPRSSSRVPGACVSDRLSGRGSSPGSLARSIPVRAPAQLSTWGAGVKFERSPTS